MTISQLETSTLTTHKDQRYGKRNKGEYRSPLNHFLSPKVDNELDNSIAKTRLTNAILACHKIKIEAMERATEIVGGKAETCNY